MRLTIHEDCGASIEELLNNYRTCNGLERISKQQPHGRKLAICGGGPSLEKHLVELKDWDGEIWAINNTGKWLLDNGIKSVFVTVDSAHPDLFRLDGMDEAIISTTCHPELRTRFSNVSLFDLIDTTEGGIPGGSSSVGKLPALSVHQGYFDITFFGCEGSFPLGRDHVDRHEGLTDSMLIIRCNGSDYLTSLPLVSQCEYLSSVLKGAPNVFKNRSGGLLEAMTNDDDWEVAAVSSGLRNHIMEHNEVCLFNQPYEVANALLNAP